MIPETFSFSLSDFLTSLKIFSSYLVPSVTHPLDYYLTHSVLNVLSEERWSENKVVLPLGEGLSSKLGDVD